MLGWRYDKTKNIFLRLSLISATIVSGIVAMSGLDLIGKSSLKYKQTPPVIIKREVNALPLPEKLLNRSYQTCTLRCLSSMRRKL